MSIVNNLTHYLSKLSSGQAHCIVIHADDSAVSQPVHLKTGETP